MVRILFCALALLASSAEAFAPLFATHNNPHHVVSRAPLSMARVPQQPSDGSDLSRRGLIHFFGVWTPLWLSWQPSSPSAPAWAADSPFGSSSVQVSDAIKTLDMSMPSYGDIKSAKASVETVDSLSVKVTPGSGGGGGLGVTKSLKKTGIPMSSVLPSMGKKSAKAKKEEKAAARQRDSGMEYKF